MGEAEEYFKEVQAVIGESWTSADDIDIASSLEMLQAELEIEETAKLPSVPKHSEDVTDLMAALPTVPASKPERTPSRSHAIEA